MKKGLFKYRTLDPDNPKSVERVNSIFIKNELYFSSPSDFNDPFDCLVHLDFSKIKKEEFWRFYNEVPARKTTLTESQRRDSFDGAYNRDDIEREFITSLQKSFSSCGVYSLSSKNDNILMWSHYSDGHRGYCFELEELEIKPQKVQYRKRFPKFNLFNNTDLLRVLLYTKSTHWKYEREWRYFSKKTGAIKINDGSIKSVIFGSQMGEKGRKCLLDIVEKSSHNPIIYEAIIDKDGYSISIQQYKI